jgi:hypothetical protein
MGRPTLFRALAIAALILAGAGALLLWTRPARITREKADAIREGMTRADVVALLGPPGNYSTGPLLAPSGKGPYVIDPDTRCTSGPDYGSEDCWVADIGVVEVRFDEDQRVMNSWFSPLDKVQQGSLENLLWRAQRQLHRWFR